jgi:hypothetical protein
MEITASQSTENDFSQCDLYLVLNLDEEEVRKKSLKQQDRVITKAFRRLIRLYHPDRHPGNEDRAQQITEAYNVLKKRNERALYHDLVDFRGSIPKRCKSVFFPESCDTKEKWKRRLLFAGSCLLLVGGIALCFGTAGLGLPIVLGCGAAGTACFNAGMFGAKRIFQIDTIENGLDCGKFLKSVLIGAAFGAGVGLVTGGIGVALCEPLALGITEFAHLDNIIAGLPGDAVNGAFFSIASDTIKSVVDKKDISKSEFVLNAVGGAFINLSLSLQLRNFIEIFSSVLTLASEGDINMRDRCKNHTLFTVKVGRILKYILKDPLYDSSDDESDDDSGDESKNSNDDERDEEGYIRIDNNCR